MAGRLTLIAGIVLLGALFAAPSAPARGPSVTLKVAKQKDGPYKTVIKTNATPSDPASVWFRAKSKSTERLEDVLFSDDGSSDQDGFKMTWFKHGDNVSSAVEGSGYDFNLDPGEAKYFNARAKPPNANADTCFQGIVTFEATFLDAAYAGINDRCEA